jgi:hypothetical protein
VTFRRTGNLSFLNWLTALPALFCFDDHFLTPLFSSDTIRRVYDLQQQPPQQTRRPPTASEDSEPAAEQAQHSRSRSQSPSPPSSDSTLHGGGGASCSRCWAVSRGAASTAISFGLGVTLLYLSLPVIRNLLQLDGRQAMNTSFGAWKLLNTYGKGFA